MTILGTGIDIVELARVREARFRERVAEYILTEEEIREMHASRDAVQYLASRFAAKEAVIKASPTTLTYQDIVISKQGEKPCAQTRNGGTFFLSISHSFTYAVANAIAVSV